MGHLRIERNARSEHLTNKHEESIGHRASEEGTCYGELVGQSFSLGSPP